MDVSQVGYYDIIFFSSYSYELSITEISVDGSGKWLQFGCTSIALGVASLWLSHTLVLNSFCSWVICFVTVWIRFWLARVVHGTNVLYI